MRVVLYARVSTQRQAEQDLSIPDQFHQLEEYRRRNRHEIIERYDDPGVSATDDNRPGFQDMIAYCLDRSNSVEAVLVLTTSRFFRDAVGARVYKEQLKRHGVQVIAITQEVSEGPGGELVEMIFEAIDQYESRMNAFHTLRGMKENARRGNLNGSQAPFGYRVETIETEGGKPRRRLVPEPEEAETVRLMFRAYVDGVDGRRMGTKTLTEHLNENGRLGRGGRPWTKMRVQERLADSTYVGEHYFNRFDSRTRQEKPRSEWILVPVPPIIDEELWQRAEQLRRANRPSKRRPPSVAGSPVLLAGLLHCGRCGARMSTETAKGQYRYYNCTTYIRRGRSACPGSRVRQDELDRAVLEHLAERLFSRERVREIVKQLATEVGRLRRSSNERVGALQARLQDVRLRIKRQYDAIESGAVDMTLVGDRLRELKAEEADLSEQIERSQGPKPLPLYLFKDESLQAVGDNLREAFLSPDSGVAKRYLNLFVRRIELEGDEVRIETNVAGLLDEGLQNPKTRTVDHSGAVLAVGNAWLCWTSGPSGGGDVRAPGVAAVGQAAPARLRLAGGEGARHP